MKKRVVLAVLGVAGIWLIQAAQQTDAIIKITQGERPGIAVPDFRGAGAAQGVMAAFNETLFRDLETSGIFKMAPKSMYPLQVPQRPEDFRAPVPPARSNNGLWLSDWSSPPVSASLLTIGYTAVQNDQLVLYGWLYNVTLNSLSGAQVLGKRYFGTTNENGARKVAHEFAADILAQYGGKSLYGTKIYFISDRTRNTELWSMDPDGANQTQITQYKSLTMMPSVSADGTKIAFTSFARGNPAIFVHSVETGRRLPFYNQVASLNATPDFTPDGHLVYASSASGYAQIYIADGDGSNLRRISSSRAIEVEPKVNPKTGTDIVFVSGRSGPQQIYRMNLDGANVERLSNGEGEASNPSWHPDGQVIAFAWTRGYAAGKFNIFIMDVAARQFNQLTHDEGRNENPSWAPDGRHIVFASDRSGTSQIYTMLADGTQVQRLTTQGRNKTPVWGKR